MPHTSSPKWTSLTVAKRHSSPPPGRGKVRTSTPINVCSVSARARRIDARPAPSWNTTSSSETDVSSRASRLLAGYHGRSRRAATGRAHQRPEKRHAGVGSSTTALVGAAGRGQVISIAATIAAISSSVGVGWMSPISGASGRCHSGMFPCLRPGSSSRLVRSMRRPAMSLTLVSAGSITSST